MSAPEGLGVWIAWQSHWHGDLGKAIEDMQRCGVKWCALRAGDGPWDDAYYSPDDIKQLKDKGIGVYSWRYSRAGYWCQELKDFVADVDHGVDGIIVDAETGVDGTGSKATDPANDWRKHHDAAYRYARELRAALPSTWIAQAPFPMAQWHLDFPYHEFCQRDVCDAVLDQLYWCDFNHEGLAPWLTREQHHWNALYTLYPDLTRNRYPVGESHSNKARLTLQDLDLYFNTFTVAPSLYSLDSASPECLAYLQKRFGHAP